MQLLKATVVAFALLALATTVAAQNEYQKLTVELPLAIKGEYDERPAMFGVPPYGGSVAGRLIYTPAGGFDGCSAMNLTQWRRNVNEVLIVAVDRGPCSFVSMVRNAQRAGAQAVVVFDSHDEVFLPYMADDGTGSDVTKPSVLLRKDSADLLRPHATGFDSNVVVTLAWDLPNPDGRVEWDFWSSVADPFSASFKRDMAIISKSLGERALVNALPLIATYEYTYCRLAPDLCGELCMNKGRYCAADPDRNTATGNSGRDVVLEDARQRCVWQHFNATGNQQGFWQYLALFEERCVTTSASGRSWPNDCWRTIIADRAVNMPESAMTACFAGANALSPDNDNDSPMLEEIIELRDLENVVKMPMIYVNSAPYLGRIECTSGQPLNTQSCPVLQTICQGFVDRSVVPSCEANVCGIGNVVDKCGVCNGDGSTCKKPRSTGGVVIVLVLIFAVLLLCGVVWYVKRRERAMAHNLDSILRSYMPVDESGRLAHTRVPLTSDGAHDVAQSGERDETEDDDRALI